MKKTNNKTNKTTSKANTTKVEKTTKVADLSKYRPIGENEERISDFNGCSVRKACEAARELLKTRGMTGKVNCYSFLLSAPLRVVENKRVIVLRRFGVAARYNGKGGEKRVTLLRLFAECGYKPATSGDSKRANYLVRMYNALLNGEAWDSKKNA